jgi:hypothetical protein
MTDLRRPHHGRRPSIRPSAGFLAIVTAWSVFAFVGTGSATEIAQCSASDGFNELTATPAQLQACGITRMAVTRTVSLPDGGMLSEYDTPDGQTLYVPSTPKRFDALTATPAERADYGLPPEPPVLDLLLRANWVQRAATWKLDAAPKYIFGASHGPDGTSEGGCSSCWAGYVTFQTDWNLAENLYSEPSLGPSRCSNDAIAMWSGIGGYGNDDFGQTGTGDGFNNFSNGAAWVETDPGPNSPPYQYPGNPTAPVNSEVYATTQWTGSRYEFTMYFSSGGSEHVMGESGKWTSTDSNADFIGEHVEGTNIANFGTLYMSGYVGQNYMPISDYADYELSIGGVTTGSDSDGDFTLTQHDCSG